MNFTYVLEFVVLRGVAKIFPASPSSFARKTTGRNRARSHSGASSVTRPKDEMGSQIMILRSFPYGPIAAWNSLPASVESGTCIKEPARLQNTGVQPSEEAELALGN